LQNIAWTQPISLPLAAERKCEAKIKLAEVMYQMC
jgi:hypothetical protein